MGGSQAPFCGCGKYEGNIWVIIAMNLNNYSNLVMNTAEWKNVQITEKTELAKSTGGRCKFVKYTGCDKFQRIGCYKVILPEIRQQISQNIKCLQIYYF
jgi:hypothetical protein